MAKVSGKDLEFWFDGQEIPVVSANLSTAFDTLDGTDSATPGTGKDTEVARASRTFTIEGNMYEEDGAEISTGTLVAGTRYRVTTGTISETQGTFTIGMIFESDGTGIASATNKVKPLGARITGKEMNLTVNSVQIPVTDIDFNLTYDELDGTDSETTGDAKEIEVSRAGRESKVSGIVRDTVADLLDTNPIAVAATLEFSSATKVIGKIIPINKNITDNVNELAKLDYTFKWEGTPAEANMGLVAGVSKAFKIILKRGSVANKEYVGNCIITGKSAKSNIAGLATISYTVSVTGAQIENEYSA